nr:unnamed protein product [Digitaria exilis]
MSDASSDLGGIRAGPVERDIEQAITALKKGAYLLKYGRRGKPKFCPFRLSNDESVLIWFSGKEEKHLRLSHVSRIIPGQRTDGSDNYRLRTPYGSPPKNGLEKAFSDVMLYAVPPRGFFPSDSNAGSVHSMSSGHSDNTNGHPRGVPMDAFRVSYSSAVSSSSHGSGHDDGDALGDVFIWGEGTGEGILGGGSSRVGSSSGSKMDCLVPKPLEFAVRLDVQNISCGGRHAALVTKQGEIYSWGEESGGRLGHGVDCDVSQPKLIDALSHMNIELVACGEYHTCAVTLSGDLYTWGDGTFKFGLLGHGNDVSHWVPKRVNGPLEDRESISVPREVESLKGLRTVRAACGVWHTAAVVEVMAGNSSSSNCSSGKIFTWGDGDKGHVYTMGSAVYGQLGNTQADGMLPVRVEGKLHKNFVEEISCGAYHVAVLTSRTEVYTWGKGANGRLGHGDTDDRNTPTLVEALKDKQLKGMAERLPGGAAKNTKLPPLPGISIPSDITSMGTESSLGSPSSSGEQITNGHNGLLAPNGPSSIKNKMGHAEVGKNGSRIPDAESCPEAEWVEQDEPGVYITLTALPGGARDLKRVRFSRKRFSETQAEQWWQENRARVYQQYNVRVVDKSTASVDNDIASN